MNENPKLQMETVGLLSVMRAWSKATGVALERKATGTAIADSLSLAMSSIQRIPLTTEDVEAGARETIGAKAAIETLYQAAVDRKDKDLGNQAVRLVLGFNALVCLFDILHAEAGHDVFSKHTRAVQRKDNPMEHFRRLFGGQED